LNGDAIGQKHHGRGTLRGLIGGLLLLPALAVSASAGSDKLFCGEEFKSVEALEALIRAKPGLKVLQSEPSVVSYSDPATSYVWNFATRANAAFPYVACRRLVAADGAYQVVTEISCGAEKAACDRLAAAYKELDRQMREAVEKEHKH
jgi:hypothetical protein